MRKIMKFSDIYDLYNVEFLSEFYSWTMKCGYGISTEYETDPSYCNNPNLTIYDVINHQSNMKCWKNQFEISFTPENYE